MEQGSAPERPFRKAHATSRRRGHRLRLDSGALARLTRQRNLSHLVGLRAFSLCRGAGHLIRRATTRRQSRAVAPRPRDAGHDAHDDEGKTPDALRDAPPQSGVCYQKKKIIEVNVIYRDPRLSREREYLMIHEAAHFIWRDHPPRAFKAFLRSIGVPQDYILHRGEEEIAKLAS